MADYKMPRSKFVSAVFSVTNRQDMIDVARKMKLFPFGRYYDSDKQCGCVVSEFSIEKNPELRERLTRLREFQGDLFGYYERILAEDIDYAVQAALCEQEGFRRYDDYIVGAVLEIVDD